MTEETPETFSPRGPSERAQAFSAHAPHRRFDHLGLWAMLRDPDLAGGPAFANTDAILDEFAIELYGYCREEKNFIQRIRILRFYRSFLITTARKRKDHGAGEKHACPIACRKSH